MGSDWVELRNPLFFVSDVATAEIISPFGEAISRMKIFSFLTDIFRKANIPERPGKYLSLSIINSFLWTAVLFLIAAILIFAGIDLETILFVATIPLAFLGKASLLLILTIVVFLFFFLISVFYPIILLKEREESIRENLPSALKDFLIQLEAGISGTKAIENIAASDYGEVSAIFDGITKSRRKGREAVEEALAAESSDYMKRVLKHIATSRKISELRESLTSILLSIKSQRIGSIKKFSAQAMFLLIIYTIFIFLIPLGTLFFEKATELNLAAFVLIMVIVEILIIRYTEIAKPKVVI